MKFEISGKDQQILHKAVNYALGKGIEFSNEELGRLLLIRNLIKK